MNGALWLLLWLRLWGWLRRLGRTMRSVRGALLIVLSAAVILLWILPNALGSAASPETLLTVRRTGPFVLVGICLVNLLFATNERVIAFSPAEVNFLFSGPISRRQLLIYKIIIASAGAVFTGLLMALVLRAQFSTFVAGFVGMTLAVMFLQLLTMTIALAGSTLGTKAYGRRRWITLVVVALILAVAVFQAGLPRLDGNPWELLAEVEQAPIMRIFLAPFQALVNTLTAERFWPELAAWAALGLAMNLALVVVILLLDAQYLEAAAAASERVYARLQRLRQGGTAALTVPTGKPRFSAVRLPRWGGIGPLTGRQLTTALRSLRALLSIVVIFSLAFVPAFVQGSTRGDGAVVAVMIGITLIGLTLFIQPLLPFDFRGDLDRMELLKAFPVPAWRLVIGQLLAPVIIVTVFQWLILVAAQTLWQRWEPFLVVIAVFALPVNLLLFGLENLLFLTFPTRLVATTPGDLHLFGRNILLWFAKFLCVSVAAIPPALLAALAYVLSAGNGPATLAAAWLGLIADLIALVPLVAFAFKKFDVATDIPA